MTILLPLAGEAIVEIGAWEISGKVSILKGRFFRESW
jgi:hypothetical protein